MATAAAGDARSAPSAPGRAGALLGFDSAEEGARTMMRLRRRLANFGLDTEQSLIIDTRLADGNPVKAAEAAAELVRLKPDLLLAKSTLAARALHDATASIPIVFFRVTDPVAAGFVSDLARPDQNMTGFVDVEPQIGGKWVSLILELEPRIRDLFIFHESDSSYSSYYLPFIMKAAEARGITARRVEIETISDFEAAVNGSRSDPSGAIVFAEKLIFKNLDYCIELLNRNRILSFFDTVDIVELSGGLISYAISGSPYREIASHVAQLLKGAKVSEIPVRKPNRLVLALNLKAATAIGIQVPQSLIAAADIIVE